jgi:hypothetical protein
MDETDRTEEHGERALLVAMPRRHLEPAKERCEAEGAAVLPAGGPGDLDVAPTGTAVLLIATDAGGAEIPAATWRGRFEGRVAYSSGDPFPTGLPETWLEEHAGSTATPASAAPPPADPTVEGSDLDDEDDDEPDDDEAVGPQSFFRVSDLAPMSRSEWIFSNELVPKQERGGRAFVPRTPRLIALPD